MNVSDQIIDFVHSHTPRTIWEMDRETLLKLRRLHDDAGKYFWSPEPNYTDMPGTLFGIEISIAKEKCFQLRYEFADGSNYIYAVPFEI